MKIIKAKSKKFPKRIKFDNGKESPVPDQTKFKNKFIRYHGCSLAGFYIGLRFCGKKETMGKLLKWIRKHLKGHIKSKLTVRGVAKGINKNVGRKVAVYHKKASYTAIKKALKAGHLVIIELGHPIHTVVLYCSNGKTYRIDHGNVTKTSAKKLAEQATSSKTYSGWIDIKG